jgi:hypothetical protein
MTLLCLQHQQGHLTEKHMLSVCSTYDTDIWCKFKQYEHGNFYNQRMEEETIKRCNFTESRRKNASKKPNTSKASEKHMPDHMGNGNINDNSNDVKKKGCGEKEFASFWTAYPKKVGKAAARKSMAKIDAALLPSILTAIEAQKKSAQWMKDGGQFIPNPATWLNQGRWEDEVTDAPKTQSPKKPVYQSERKKTPEQELKEIENMKKYIAQLKEE